MKIFEHYSVYPHDDQVRFFNNWSQFNDDPRTQEIDLHIGCAVDFGKIRNDKINVHTIGERPNSWFNGKRRGQNVPLNLEIEKRFDYIISACKQTAFGRGYIYAPYCFDFEHVHAQLGMSFDDIDNIKKDIDVFMCATCPGKYSLGELHPVWPWYNVMQKFNHIFCNSDMNKRYPWKEKQLYSIRSKISIVFADFIGSTPECREYAKQHVPWVKFKKNNEIKPVTPQAKGRIFDAAFSKSIILCFKSPFVGELPPYNCAIEDYLDPKTDFIYFDGCDDLEKKIEQILGDYDNLKYKKMVDSAYNNMKKNCDINVLYEKHLVSLAEKGKTK